MHLAVPDNVDPARTSSKVGARFRKSLAAEDRTEVS